MNEDDPFANIFLKKEEEKKINDIEKALEDKLMTQRSKDMIKKQLAQSCKSEGASDDEQSECSEDKDQSENSNISNKDEKICDWKNKAYWSLPENVRSAIDLAKAKKKHSDFYYKLKVTNDKIQVYT